MKTLTRNKNLYFLIVPLVVLVAIVSAAGIFTGAPYQSENEIYAAQGRGQDIIDLFILTPVLLISSILVFSGSGRAVFVLLGSLIYSAYTFIIYSFGMHFNSFFLLYCASMGLSVYAIIFIVVRTGSLSLPEKFDRGTPVVITAIYLFFIAVVFYFVWLSEIIPAILNHTVPKSIEEAGLMVNPVHVLDLAVALPACIFAGITLLRRENAGFLLAPALLFFAFFMALAIASMVITMQKLGFNTDTTLMYGFGVLALVAVVLFVLFIRHFRQASDEPLS